MIMVAPQPRQRRFWYACQQIRKRSPGVFILSYGLHGLGETDPGVSLLSTAALLVSVPGDRGRVRETFFPLSFSPFHFQGLGKGG